MIDDLAELAAAAATDVAIENAAKRHRWARIIRAIIGLSFIGAIAVAIFITFKYSQATVDNVISLTLYMLLSPIILIPCLFVGTANLRFPYALLLGWSCSSIGALFTFPLIHFFVVSSPVPSSGSTFLNALIAGVIAGSIITSAMYAFSHRGGSNDSNQP